MSEALDLVAQAVGEQEIVRIPIASIHVANPRVRSRKTFAGIVESIATVGLKRPITVVETGSDADGPRYDLVCGQGRIEAFLALGESDIPAVIVRADESDRYLMSLVENLARRKHSNRDLLAAVRALEDRGYRPVEIARKTGLDQTYIVCILALLKDGEERLIAAVEQGWLPISLATDICRAGEADVQIAMMQAYETGVLRGEQLMKVRRLIDARKALGPGYGVWKRKATSPSRPPSSLRRSRTRCAVSSWSSARSTPPSSACSSSSRRFARSSPTRTSAPCCVPRTSRTCPSRSPTASPGRRDRDRRPGDAQRL